MLKKSIGVLALASLLGLGGCADENPWMETTGGRGTISLSLSADGNVVKAIPQSRADGDAPLFDVPTAEDFSIELEKTDGSYSKTFPTLQHFRNEGSFPAGRYVMRALYGNLEDNEGFDYPHFAGSAEFTVLEGQTTDVQLTATVAHAVVTIDYSEAFKKYFKDWSATLHSEGHGYVTFATDESRAAFVAPGQVSLQVSFTNQQNQSVTVEPASFLADAAHHYHINFNVADGGSEASLTIQFVDDLTTEDVVIDLTDELFSTPGPKINAKGFTVPEGTDEVAEQDFLEGSLPAETLRFDVISYGGMREVVLTIASNSYEPSFGKEINLLGASPAVQEQLRAAGFDIRSIFENADRMGWVDFTKFVAKLPAGRHTISLKAKDGFSRVSTPVSFTMNIVAPELKVDPESGVAIFGVGEGSLSLAYNGTNPSDAITFKAQNRFGTYEDCEAEFNLASRSRAFESLDYNVTLSLPDIGNRTLVPVQVFLFGNLQATVNLKVSVPEYSLVADPFARKAIIKITPDDPSLLAVITDNLRLYNGGSQITSGIERDNQTGYVTLTGLEPQQTYSLVGSLIDATQYTHDLSFTTEAAAVVPNGDFAANNETLRIDPINTGGGYYLGAWLGDRLTVKYQNTTSISVVTPDNWSDINAVTCNRSGIAYDNTWSVVPSTLMRNDSVVVRTVGYNYTGEGLEYHKSSVSNYYSQNSPAKGDLAVAAGEFFLGSDKAKGLAFGSRPSSMTVTYDYAGLGSEQGLAEVALVDASGAVIASGTANLASGSKSTTIALTGYPFGSKAAALRITFLSSGSLSPDINIPTGTDLKDNSTLSMNYKIATNQYKALATGSELRIAKVTFNY